eukprot:3908057-Rhodomonas_salina.1
MNEGQVQQLVDSVLQKVREASQGEDGYVPSESGIKDLVSLVMDAVETAANVGEILLVVSKWLFTVEEVLRGVRFLASIAWDMSRGNTNNDKLQLRWQAYLEHVVCTSLSLSSVKVVLFVFDKHLKKFDDRNIDYLLGLSEDLMPTSSFRNEWGIQANLRRARDAPLHVLQFRRVCSARAIMGMLRYQQAYVSSVWKLAAAALVVSKMLTGAKDPSFANAVQWGANASSLLRRSVDEFAKEMQVRADEFVQEMQTRRRVSRVR